MRQKIHALRTSPNLLCSNVERDHAQHNFSQKEESNIRLQNATVSLL